MLLWLLLNALVLFIVLDTVPVPHSVALVIVWRCLQWWWRVVVLLLVSGRRLQRVESVLTALLYGLRCFYPATVNFAVGGMCRSALIHKIHSARTPPVIGKCCNKNASHPSPAVRELGPS